MRKRSTSADSSRPNKEQPHLQLINDAAGRKWKNTFLAYSWQKQLKSVSDMLKSFQEGPIFERFPVS